jgi:hypothetical protein
VSMSRIDPLQVANYNEDALEALFRRCQTMGIDTLVNQGGAPTVDLTTQTIRNDDFWKGFFPADSVLNDANMPKFPQNRPLSVLMGDATRRRTSVSQGCHKCWRLPGTTPNLHGRPSAGRLTGQTR